MDHLIHRTHQNRSVNRLQPRRLTSRDGDASGDDRRELGRGQLLDHPAQRGEQPFDVRGVVEDEARRGLPMGVVAAAAEGSAEEHSREGLGEGGKREDGSADGVLLLLLFVMVVVGVGVGVWISGVGENGSDA